MGAVANPTHISQVCLLSIGYTVVIITTKFESFSGIPTSLRLKKDNGSYSLTDVCRVCRWGEGPDSLDRGPLGAGSGAGLGAGGTSLLGAPSGLLAPGGGVAPLAPPGGRADGVVMHDEIPALDPAQAEPAMVVLSCLPFPLPVAMQAHVTPGTSSSF